MCRKASCRLCGRAHNKQANIFAGMQLLAVETGKFQFAKEQFFLTGFSHNGFVLR